MLKKENIFFQQNLKTRDDVFDFVANEAVNLGVITKTNKQKLINAFIKREEESTTGFEDGFAIPHARIKEVKKPTIIVVRCSKGVE
jgi:PTS system fructose-specific IIC component